MPEQPRLFGIVSPRRPDPVKEELLFHRTLARKEQSLKNTPAERLAATPKPCF